MIDVDVQRLEGTFEKAESTGRQQEEGGGYGDDEAACGGGCWRQWLMDGWMDESSNCKYNNNIFG